MTDEERDEIVRKLRELREVYADAHRLGMECLERHDLEGFDQALRTEARLIEEQATLIKQLRDG